MWRLKTKAGLPVLYFLTGTEEVVVTEVNSSEGLEGERGRASCLQSQPGGDLGN